MRATIAHICGHDTHILADCAPHAARYVRSARPCTRCLAGVQCADLLAERGLGRGEFHPAAGHAGGDGFAGYVCAALVSSLPAYHRFADLMIEAYSHGQFEGLDRDETARLVAEIDRRADPAHETWEQQLGF